MTNEADNGKAGGRGEGDGYARRMKCEEIQALLFDYMSRELGGARSVLVREHLRKCPECQAAAAEIQSTLDALRETPVRGPDRLSDEHRARIVRAITHPIIDWIDRHHILTAAIVVILVAAAVLVWTRRLSILETDDTPRITVTIGGAPAEFTDPENRPTPGPESP